MICLKLLNFPWLLFIVSLCTACSLKDTRVDWPEVSKEAKPWTRWWWHGSAVTREGITHELEELKKAGINA